MVRNTSSSYKIDYVQLVRISLNPQVHQNCITGSIVTQILLEGGTFPIGRVALGKVCTCSLPSRFVLKVVATLGDGLQLFVIDLSNGGITRLG